MIHHYRDESNNGIGLSTCQLSRNNYVLIIFVLTDGFQLLEYCLPYTGQLEFPFTIDIVLTLSTTRATSTTPKTLLLAKLELFDGFRWHEA